jgi:PhnB protein
MTDPTRPDPSVMVGPIPYLALAGQGNAALDFFARAFGATRIQRMPFPDRPEGLMHGQCVINGGALMLTDHVADGSDDAAPVIRGHLQLIVDNGQAWMDRALAAGCTPVMPFARQPWGDDWGMVRDPFGLSWGILQPEIAQ